MNILMTKLLNIPQISSNSISTLELISEALIKKNPESLKIFHLLLNKIYEQNFLPNTKTNIDVISIIIYRELCERLWIQDELKHIDANKLNVPLTIEAIYNAFRHHPISSHNLFSFFEQEASAENFKDFLLIESVMNLEFFDFLALSILGTTGKTKLEIISNMWDEAGKGEIKYFHTTMFEDLLAHLELTYNKEEILKRMDWTALAGLNLFYYLCLVPANKVRLFGGMAATELLDPKNYEKFVRGFNRAFGDSGIDLSYYKEHTTIDILHAEGWIKNVAVEEVRDNPILVQEFWEGFYLRLNSTLRYYDATQMRLQGGNIDGFTSN